MQADKGNTYEIQEIDITVSIHEIIALWNLEVDIRKHCCQDYMILKV